MNLFNNIRRAGKYFLPTLLAFGLLMACSDDEVIQTPLDTPNVTNSELTVSSLTFTWDAVPNVSSYSCELSDPNGIQVAGLVTTSTTARFTGLLPNTTYTLNVYAYAAIGSSNTTSKVATLTATTPAVVPLEAPRELVAEVNSTTATITWQAVENAVGYGYSYMKEEEAVEGTVSEPSLTLKNLAPGSYRVSIYAIAGEEDEAHSDSPASAVMFDVVREKQALWSRTGTYYSEELNGEWEAKLTAYDDGSYKLSGWYGVEGYDLDFTVEGEEMVIQNHYTENDGYFFVYTGRSDATIMGIYPSGGYSSFEGDENGGELWFYAYGIYANDEGGEGGYEYFVWSANNKITIDDLVGLYSEESSGYDYYIYSGYWGTTDYSFHLTPDDEYAMDVKIAKVDDTTISLTGFYWAEESLVGTVDLDARTITFATGQPWHNYYEFASEKDASTPVVATFDENGVITINGWGAWYDGYTYCEDTHTVLTPQ